METESAFEGEDMVETETETETEPVFVGDKVEEDQPGDNEDHGFDSERFNTLIESNNEIMQRLQIGPDPVALLEMRLKSTILMFAGERGLFDVEMRVQEWLSEGLVEAETEMNRQKLLEGVNMSSTNNIMPMPHIVKEGM